MRRTQAGRRAAAAASLGALLATVGCTATINPSKAQSGAGGAMQTGTGSASGMAGAPGTAGAGAAVPYGPTSGRRLTRAEYTNTVTDIFGTMVAASVSLLPDDQPPDNAFRNDIAGRAPSDKDIAAYGDVAASMTAVVPAATFASFTSCAMATKACEDEFIARLGKSLYRRPLTDAEVQRYEVLFTASASDASPFPTGASLVLQALLQSADFLYQLEESPPVPGAPSPPSSYEVASRLSFLLWKSGPDPSLLDIAARNDLASESAFASRVDAMLSDARARRGLRDYADDWLRLYANPVRTPVPALGLTATLLTDMREETLSFLERLSFDDKADLMRMFLDQKTVLSPELARLYGLTPTSNATAVYDLTGDRHRVGLLTQAAFLGVRAAPGTASLVQRGLMVMNNIACQDVPSPPPDAAIKLQDVPATLPERARFAMHEQFGSSCTACHTLIDPFGWPFTVYDLAGRWGAQDANGNSLDTTGQLNLDGMVQPYRDASDFAAVIGKSPTIERCLTTKYLQYATGRSLTDHDRGFVDGAVARFHKGGRLYTDLVHAVTDSAVFRAPAPEMFP